MVTRSRPRGLSVGLTLSADICAIMAAGVKPSSSFSTGCSPSSPSSKMSRHCPKPCLTTPYTQPPRSIRKARGRLGAGHRPRAGL